MRQVQVGRAQAVQFFGPEAGRDRQSVERLVPIPGRRFEETARLVGIEKSNFRPARLYRPLALGRTEARARWVAINKLPFERELKRTPQNRLRVFDGAVAQATRPERL